MNALLGASVIPFEDLLWRLGAAALFGMLLGIDREIRGKSAGIRTHMLVALSSATTMLIALELFEELSGAGKSPDPTRAIQGLAQAIGFICAGVIFVARGNVRGLTTAASLWMTSSVGMAAGAGMNRIAVTAVVLALLILTVLWVVTRAFEPWRKADGGDRDD
ncbi:hypothetical protein GCM10007036_22690 [Alsobacter metallidurans]|uniref:Protein MgtC n=1 Tax=Alsobacter metallidurans TaxID=340221 RepID=A0A917MI85_9HYPH|nr:MgtC/SapB family protein [Alsobacter metallidurans]GGH19642.1 hypothetical protein GCM10007036_22690 [Alsobacter metallidurans]